MKLFAKVTFICNVSFVVFVVLRYIEFNSKKHRPDGNLIPLPYITGILVILGELAIFINLVFCLVMMIILVSKKMQQRPPWLVIANFIFLVVELYYFFM